MKKDTLTFKEVIKKRKKRVNRMKRRAQLIKRPKMRWIPAPKLSWYKRFWKWLKNLV